MLKLTKNGRKVAELFKEIVKLLECDLVSRDRIEKLKEIYERSPKNFRSLAGIIAEIERLKKSKDEEVLRIVNDLENEIKKVISNDGGGS